MGVDRSFASKNAVERERLRALVTRLSDNDLGRPLAAGWTVAGVLGHLAFWDQRILVLLERWEREGLAAVPRRLDEADVDWINDAAKPVLLALAPRRAAELAVTVAQAVDRKIEALGDDFVTRNAAAGTPVNLSRADHRQTHLGEIERALKS